MPEPNSAAQQTEPLASRPAGIIHDFADIDAALANIDFRHPIIEDPTPEEKQSAATQNAEIDKQWLTLTESIRKAVMTDPVVRRQLAGLISNPLSEALPLRAVEEVAAKDGRTARVMELTKPKLDSLLRLEPVPDELLWPDLRRAPQLASVRLKTEADLLRSVKILSPGELQVALERSQDQLRRQPGISEAERSLAARRYRYARDIKMLALMAELHDQPLQAPNIEDGLVTHELDSGTRLVMSAEAFKSVPSLLDPEGWESRHQIKDRVYKVKVGGRDFILKERKTRLHTDLKKHGHRDGLTSREEFETAHHFAGLGVIRQGDVRLYWEKPLGYVEFPDGHQFCLFANVEDMQIDFPKKELTNRILAAPAAYKEEYEKTSSAARRFYSENRDLLKAHGFDDVLERPKKLALSKAARNYKRYYRGKPAPDDLTFEEFAEVKAHHLLLEARELLNNTMKEQGFANSDLAGFGFRVRGKHPPKLEIIGFDFEYYKKDSHKVVRLREQGGQQDRSRQTALNSGYRAGERGISLAASLVITQRQGKPLPPVPDQTTPSGID